jgi:hypothetical protein
MGNQGSSPTLPITENQRKRGATKNSSSPTTTATTNGRNNRTYSVLANKKRKLPHKCKCVTQYAT